MVDIFAIVISIISLIVVNITWYYSYKQNKYEYKSIQDTKSDFMRLIAALKSISRKATYNHLVENGKIDFSNEMNIIQDFLTSDTWLVVQQIISEDDIFMFYSKIIIVLYENTDVRDKGLFSRMALEHIARICRNYSDDIENLKKDYSSNIADYTYLDKHTDNFYDKYQKNIDKLMSEKVSHTIESLTNKAL